MSSVKKFFGGFLKSTYLPLEFKDVGLLDSMQIREVIEDYAQENGHDLAYQKPDMPEMHFTLDGVPYTVHRGTSRGGPTVGAMRDAED